MTSRTRQPPLGAQAEGARSIRQDRQTTMATAYNPRVGFDDAGIRGKGIAVHQTGTQTSLYWFDGIKVLH